MKMLEKALKRRLPYHAIARKFAQYGIAERLVRATSNDLTRKFGRSANTWGKSISLISRYRRDMPKIVRQVTYASSRGDICFGLDLSQQIECSCYYGDINPPLSRFIMACDPNESGVMIDIGANFGFFSCLGALYFDRVYSFEPVPATFAKLKANAEANGLENLVCRQSAVSASSGTLNLAIHPLNHAASRIGGFSNVPDVKRTRGYYDENDIEVTAVSVPSVTLDEVLCDVQNLHFIKVDVEGHEALALAGATTIIERNRPVIFAETWTAQSANMIADVLPSSYRRWNPQTQLEVTRWAEPDTVFSISDPWRHSP